MDCARWDTQRHRHARELDLHGAGRHLSVDGTVGATTVNGGLLAGNGTLGGLTVNGGIVGPGHSIGTLNVLACQLQRRRLQVETNLAGLSDKIVATGTATLTGGTVQVIAQAGASSSAITYTILTAASGRTGAFAGVTTNIPYLSATLAYDANDVFLNLVRNQTFFQDQGLTRNQRAVGSALDRFRLHNPLFAARRMSAPVRSRARSTASPARSTPACSRC